MKKEKILGMLIKFIKSKHFWKLILLIFLIGILWSGFRCETKWFKFDKPQIKTFKVK